MKVSAVSVIVCTFNRARLLRETLASMQAMVAPPECAVEVIVVDNNSTDETAAIIDEAAAAARFPIVALKESQQGKSFALNRALVHAAGDVLALTDDDVLLSSDWLERIVDAFRTREVTFVFGKVLPRWSRLPPPELLMPQAQDIWGPLALVDYGDTAAEYHARNMEQHPPIGANLSFSRAALLAIGGWRTDLGKVDNTLISGEDHEIFMRFRQFHLYAGYYDPDLTVRHFVPVERLTRRYFRRWFFWRGKTQARMFDELHPEVDMTRVPHLAGIPRFALRQGLEQSGRWLRALSGGDALSILIEELWLIQYAGLLVESWRRRHHRGRAATLDATSKAPAIGGPAGAAP